MHYQNCFKRGTAASNVKKKSQIDSIRCGITDTEVVARLPKGGRISSHNPRAHNLCPSCGPHRRSQGSFCLQCHQRPGLGISWKGRISPTTSYDRVIHAFITSIREHAELEPGGNEKGSYSKKGLYRRAELYKSAKPHRKPVSNQSSDEDVFINEDEPEPLTREELISTLDTYFENAKFAHHPKSVKPNANSSLRKPENFNHTATRRVGPSAKSIGSFNCERMGWSVAIFKRPRDASRLANNITRSKELRKLNKSANMNYTNVQSACADSFEANEVMVSAILVNQYNDESEADGEDEECDPFATLEETLRSNASEHVNNNEEATWFGQTFDVGIKEGNIQMANVHRLSPTKIKYGVSAFHGACIDTGPQRSVCGVNQARAYQKQNLCAIVKGKPNVQFRFGEQVASRIGKVNIKIPINDNNHLSLMIYVVDLDIPLVIGLDVLRGHRLLVNYIENTIYFCDHKIYRPIKQKMGHVFLEWNEHEILTVHQRRLK